MEEKNIKSNEIDEKDRYMRYYRYNRQQVDNEEYLNNTIVLLKEFSIIAEKWLGKEIVKQSANIRRKIEKYNKGKYLVRIIINSSGS